MRSCHDIYVRTSSRIPERLVEILVPRLALMPAVRLVKELCAGRAANGSGKTSRDKSLLRDVMA